MSAGSHGPVRTCVGCGRRRPVDELVRLVRLPDGGLRRGRTAPGRGAWLCAGDPDCVERAGRRRALDRALRAPVSAEAYHALPALMGTGPVAPH